MRGLHCSLELAKTSWGCSSATFSPRRLAHFVLWQGGGSKTDMEALMRGEENREKKKEKGGERKNTWNILRGGERENNGSL